MDVKTIIKKQGHTIESVAAKLGISRVTLSQNLSGNPSLTTLKRIADAIGCCVGEFFLDELNTQGNHIKCPHCGKDIVLDIKAK